LLPIEKELFFAWQYPPIALLLVYPLAFLPYLWSLASWLAVGIACYITVLWRILPQPLTLVVGLAFPAVLLTIEHGQNALLSTSFLGWALLLLIRRPIAAGVLLGFLSFKPQLGVLLPIALVAGGHWKTILAAMLTGAGLVATTVALFGGGIWHEFIASTQLSRDILNQGLVPYYKMQSVFAAVRLLGSSLILAYSLQVIVAAGAAAGVVWVEACDGPRLEVCHCPRRYPHRHTFFSRLRPNDSCSSDYLARAKGIERGHPFMARDNAGFTLAYAFGFPAYRCVYGHTIGASCRSWRLRVHFSAGEPLFERSGSVTSGRPLRLTTQNTRISISTCTVRSVVLLFYKLPRVEIGLAVLVALAILPRLQPLLDRRSAGADRAVRLALRSGRFCRGPHSSRGAA
jgi:hypothetical protein